MVDSWGQMWEPGAFAMLAVLPERRNLCSVVLHSDKTKGSDKTLKFDYRGWWHSFDFFGLDLWIIPKGRLSGVETLV